MHQWLGADQVPSYGPRVVAATLCGCRQAPGGYQHRLLIRIRRASAIGVEVRWRFG